MKQVLILSGKGGTGKTTIASAFIKLSQSKKYGDCDVDAPNLHLLLEHHNAKTTNFYGLPTAKISKDKCINCGECQDICRFSAVYNNNKRYFIDESKCEGCGVCELICPERAITMVPKISGTLKLYKNDTLFSTAQLKMGSGNSGKLVTEVKKQLSIDSMENGIAIIDGSPGIGCPVIASISGVDFVLIVAEPSLSGFSDCKRIVKTAKKFNPQIAICVNKFDLNLKISLKIKQYAINNDINFAGYIPFDENVPTAINNGISILDIDCLAQKAIKNMYLKLFQGGTYENCDCK